jgi:hypothetical protein
MPPFARSRSLTIFALGAAVAAGCGGEGADGDDVAVVDSAVLSENALTSNALTSNALTSNALTSNALTSNALTSNALTSNALTSNALHDPDARELLKYVVSCALDEDDELTLRAGGRRYVFRGSLGLAPEWGRDRGRCDGDCQRWVSACVLARVDHEGVKRVISLRGEHPALRSEPSELRRFTHREAAFYGNLFVAGQPMFMCLSPGEDGNERVCGDSLADCPMAVVGHCDDACDDEGPYRSFSDCSDRGRAGRGRTFHESITVFLPK